MITHPYNECIDILKKIVSGKVNKSTVQQAKELLETMQGISKISNKYLMVVDPGHAWLKVPTKDIKILGIQKSISEFSYMSERYVYLEEDVDAPMYIKRYITATTRKPELTYNNMNRLSSVRKLAKYSFEKIK